jgi:hypothetical protein
MAHGEDLDLLTPRVQERRMLPVKVIQAIQRVVHERVIGAAFRSQTPKVGFLPKLVDAVPLLQRIPARILGLGIRREHIRSPKA